MENMYKFGYPQARRISEIQNKINKSGETFGIEYMGEYRQLPVIEVRIGLPVYRIENIRTVNLQKEFLALHQDVDKELFLRDPYSIETQESQHQLLNQVVNQEGLLSTFKKDGIHQTEPIVCADDGVIVNGNRRMCAWRELYYSDREVYKYFETVRVAILPDHDSQAMHDLEVALQIQSPMKADYAWHAIAYMIKTDVSRGVDTKKIANSLKMNEKDVLMEVDCYDYAEEFLRLKGYADQWSKVDRLEYAFQEIVKGRKTFSDPVDKELFEQLSMDVISQPAKGERLYSLIPKIVTNLTPITNRLYEVLEIEEIENEENEIDILLGGNSKENSVKTGVVNSLRKEEDSSIIVDTVKTVIKTQEELSQEKKNRGFVLAQAVKAVTALNNAISNLNDSMSKEGVRKQLEIIKFDCGLLGDWIGNENEN